MASLINKAKKPKFELHLRVYDLNNVPLVCGVSQVKWHLPHSMHSEHRGRTAKCPIAHHRVEYNYAKVISLRTAIDRNNKLSECWIEFEVVQEFSIDGEGGKGSGAVGIKEEKVTLGIVRLNLSEYVEEGEAILREGGSRSRKGSAFSAAYGRDHKLSTIIGSPPLPRSKRSSFSTDKTLPEVSPRSSTARPGTTASGTANDPFPEEGAAVFDAEEGVVRRYLMQDSKINSTLKLGILMVQIEGERNYVAPPLKSAPVFGGIAGIMGGRNTTAADPFLNEGGSSRFVREGGRPSSGRAAAAAVNGLRGATTTLTGKSCDMSELQDMYRRALAAYWVCHPNELPADACIEDIFAGGDGFRGGYDVGRDPDSESASLPARRHTPKCTHTSARSAQPRLRFPADDDSDSSDDTPLGIVGATALTGSSGAGIQCTKNLALAQGQQQQYEKVGGEGRPPSAASERGRHVNLRDKYNNSLTSSSTDTLCPAPNSSTSLSTRADGVDVRGSLADALVLQRKARSRSGSLATQAGSFVGRGRDGNGEEGLRKVQQVNQFDVREDLVAWSLPGRSL